MRLPSTDTPGAAPSLSPSTVLRSVSSETTMGARGGASGAEPSRTPVAYSSSVVAPLRGFGCFAISSSSTVSPLGCSSPRCAPFACPSELNAAPSCWSLTLRCTARSTLPDSASPPIAASYSASHSLSWQPGRSSLSSSSGEGGGAAAAAAGSAAAARAAVAARSCHSATMPP